MSETAEHAPSGRSLRDWFAGQALGHLYQMEMQVLGPRRIGQLLAGERPEEKDEWHWARHVARDAYILADAMLAERERKD